MPRIDQGRFEIWVEPNCQIEIIAYYFKTTFKEYNRYEAFQISAPRRVRSFGCVRFWDASHRRTYVVFINGKNVLRTKPTNAAVRNMTASDRWEAVSV
jgi:hypothetical protein